MSATKFGSFEDLLASTTVALQPVVKELKKVILSIDPQAHEVVRLGDRAATYGLGPRKMKEGYTYILPHKSWVNLGFYQGATLADPDGILEGTGKKLRHVKIKSIEEANAENVKTLIALAVAERKAACSSA